MTISNQQLTIVCYHYSMSLIRRFSQSTLIRGSILVFLGNNIASFGNLLYNLIMGRLLGPEKYGDLGSVLSTFTLLGVPLSILNLTIVKIVSGYWGGNKKKQIIPLIRYFAPRVFLIGCGFVLLLLFLIPSIVSFLNMNTYAPFIIVALSILLAGPMTINGAIIQGTLSFSYIALNNILLAILKLVFSVILVLLNLAIAGALLGPLISNIIVYLLSFFQLKIILPEEASKKSSISFGSMISTMIPVFLATLSLTMFLTVDIIWVRHFFSAKLAGEYVALTTVGKVILYAIGPIITVMFPLISTRTSSGLSYILPLFGTLVLSLSLAAVVIFAFFLFPKVIIAILFGSKYFGVIPFLGLFSFFITIYTISAVLTNFILSISYYKPISFLFLASFLQSLFIIFFHATITQVIWSNIASSAIYLAIVSFFVIRKEMIVIRRILLRVLPKGVYGGKEI